MSKKKKAKAGTAEGLEELLFCGAWRGAFYLEENLLGIICGRVDMEFELSEPLGKALRERAHVLDIPVEELVGVGDDLLEPTPEDIEVEIDADMACRRVIVRSAARWAGIRVEGPPQK